MKRLSIFLLLVLCASASPRLIAQVRPVNDYGAMGLAQMLRRLQTTASVMMIGAHPDDEDSALLAYLARGENARTAYLSLTRGDGGQNIIGPELFESLGVIRTEELLQARRLDGAEQYFARAYDYGFSKTLAEAKQKWPEDVIKCDVVRAIRLFRPFVVISRFTGTPRDGHGQHQYAGYITPIAVKAAAEPQQCADAGEPWTVKKFYVEGGFGDNSEPTLRINTGQFDPILGRTYFEIAMEGRSQHRSQGEGRIEFHGDSFSGLNLVGAAKDLREKSIFDGLDTSLAGLRKTFLDTGPEVAEIVDSALARAQPAAEHAQSEFDIQKPGTIVRDLVSGIHFLDIVTLSPEVGSEARNAIYLHRAEFKKAIREALGIQIDALADRETTVPGDDLMISVKAFLPKDSTAKIGNVTLTVPNGWIVNKTDLPQQSNAAYNSREVATAGAVFSVHVDPAAELTEPYWLRTARKSNLFEWPNTGSQTLPFDPPSLVAHVTVNINGTDVTLDQPVQYRYADPARGEIRREINVVPPVSVTVDKSLLVAPLNSGIDRRKLNVTVRSNSMTPVSGKVELTASTFTVVGALAPPPVDFQLRAKGESAVVSFDLPVGRGGQAMSIPIQVSAVVGQKRFSESMNVISYPHIQTHRYYTPAEVRVLVLDLKTVPLNVGYIMGSGDEVPDAIREMGMNVTLLDEKALASGDLSKYDTIVVGIRASETRPDFVANNKRLLDYVNAGGNLIVQYQRGNFAASGLLPFPANAQDRQGTAAGSIARVVDENAPVEILQPQHPIFNFPNKITQEDFKGWVQERNAYNLVTFDQRYTPLLESHDPGEIPNQGGLVLTNLGKGTYIYTSYSWFRQLPAGVPGAYRIFANLIALPKASRKNP
jgi:LmbE family N-acetylglucosaminyl deacetylase